MKKYALLSMIVLAMSSTAFGICRMQIEVTPPECGSNTLVGGGTICCSGQWNMSGYEVSRIGNQIYLDFYLSCTSPCGYHTEQGTDALEIPGCPFTYGLYVLVARVWMDYSECQCWPYCLYQNPLLVGMAMTSFKVCCDECGSYPCCCGPIWPCCVQ